jgi:hypothetical protein
MGSIAETLLMGIGKQRTSMAARLAGRADAKALELEIAQVAALELATGREVALELETLEAVIVRVEALERGIVQEVVLELETSEVAIVRVVELEREISEVEIVPEAVVEQGIGLVGEPETLELVIAPAEALEREIVQVAVLLRTKSVTAALRCGLLAVLAVAAGDLAAAAVETTRGPAAAEAATAWAAEE